MKRIANAWECYPEVEKKRNLWIKKETNLLSVGIKRRM